MLIGFVNVSAIIETSLISVFAYAYSKIEKAVATIVVATIVDIIFLLNNSLKQL